jgi:hypothetical protein
MIPPITQPITREQFEETALAALDSWWPDCENPYRLRTHVEEFIEYTVRNWQCIVTTATVSQPIEKPRRLYNRHARKRMQQDAGGR